MKHITIKNGSSQDGVVAIGQGILKMLLLVASWRWSHQWN